MSNYKFFWLVMVSFPVDRGTLQICFLKSGGPITFDSRSGVSL